MFGNNQRTIANEIACYGKGLHSGSVVNLKFIPASEDHGVVFKRLDVIDENPFVKASYESVSNTLLSTNLENANGVKIGTIEHLMAALWGVGVDNLLIEIDGPEVPIMDGSSEPFVFILECAGIVEQGKKRRVMELLREINITDGKSQINVTPAEEFSIDVEIDFPNKLIAKQSCKFDLNESFKIDISRARTFGFAQDVEKLRSQGLALGGSLDNVVVVKDDKVLNEGGLRYHNEFVRHKLLDSIGDLYLAGCYIKGHFQLIRPGHTINNKILHQIFADQSAWRYSVC